MDAPTPLRLADWPEPIEITEATYQHREWFGVLEGEGERDVRVCACAHEHAETAVGLAELHRLRPTGEDQGGGQWVLYGWLD